jgi:hypothetical protein
LVHWLVGPLVGWLVGPLVGPLVRWSVCPHITSKTGYVAISLRLGFGNNLVLRHTDKQKEITVIRFDLKTSDLSASALPTKPWRAGGSSFMFFSKCFHYKKSCSLVSRF